MTQNESITRAHELLLELVRAGMVIGNNKETHIYGDSDSALVVSQVDALLSGLVAAYGKHAMPPKSL